MDKACLNTGCWLERDEAVPGKQPGRGEYSRPARALLCYWHRGAACLRLRRARSKLKVKRFSDPDDQNPYCR
jgi:hypothetical protein